ncbi:MAG: PhzF family phenazine biosynthesis protein [Candidatus Dormiibacterota bacterium]
MDLDFVLADVFSAQPFMGNQLAVIPHAEGLTDATMQAIAREFNFSETTFVLPPENPTHTCRLRIFTPRHELPFAGHPTLGTAAVLARRMDAHPSVRQRFTFEEGIGPVAVDVDSDNACLRLRSPNYETTAESPPIHAIAKALSLRETDITESWCAGVGLRFCYVRLANFEAVDRAALDKSAWAVSDANGWSSALYVFAGEWRSGARLYARCFAPGAGVDEDPATGSACAGLVASLAERSPAGLEAYELWIDQGVRMGRPSVLHAEARRERGRLTEVNVSGPVTIVGTGVITLREL